MRKNNRRKEQSLVDSWPREVTGFIFLLLLTSCQLVPNSDDKPKVIENPTFHGPESQGEAKSVPYIPGQEYQKFNYKIKWRRRKKRHGKRGRKKRSRVIRYHQYDGTAEGEGDDDVGLFTRLWRWIGSFFTWKTRAATTLQQVNRANVSINDAAKITSLVQDTDGGKKQTDLEEKKTICAEKNDDKKDTTTCDIQEDEEKTKVIKECQDDSNIVNEKILENQISLNMKDSCTNENVVSGCFSVKKSETHVLKKTDDTKCYSLVPLKHDKPAQQTTDTTNETASSGAVCCSVQKPETHILQKTDDFIPPKPLEVKPSLQLTADTTTETEASADPECRPVQLLETQMEPNRTQVDYKVKVIKRKNRSGVKRRRKRKRVIRYQNKGTTEEVDDDVGLFTRLWQWIGSFFTRQTTAATPLQQEERRDKCPEDAAKTNNLLQDVDSDKKQTDLEKKKKVCQGKPHGNKETTACDIRVEERKLKDVIKEGHEESSIEQRKDEKSLTVKERCTDANVVSGCFTVQQLEAHIMQETDDQKLFDLVSLKQVENNPSSKIPEDTTTKAVSSGPGSCDIRRSENHVLQETEDPKRFNLLPLKQLESKPIRQLPISEEYLEARSKSVIRNDGDKSILGHRQNQSDLQKAGKSKTVDVVPLKNKQPEHKVTTASQESKRSTTSWRKHVPRTTLTRDGELPNTGSSTPKVQSIKERSTIFKGTGQKDSRKQEDFARSRRTDQGKDHFSSNKRYYKPNKKSNPKQTTDLSSKEEKPLSWRNRTKESAESSKGHAHSTWGNQKKGSESHLVPSSNWRRSSSKGDMSSNWRKGYGTNNPVSKSQTSSWRNLGTNNTRTSPNKGTLPYRRNNNETRAEPCESNWRMRTESSPRKQTNHTMERPAEKCQTSTTSTAREKAEQSAKENTPKMTYAQAVLRGRLAVRNPPKAINPARVVMTETRHRSSHGQRQ